MGRTLSKKQLGLSNRPNALLNRTFVSVSACLTAGCLTVALAGCSQIGSRQALDQRRLPFSVSADGSALKEIDSDTNRIEQLRDSIDGRIPGNPVREQSRTVQAVKTRPPKLSALPKMTLYAQPVVTADSNASQVSWEQDAQPVGAGGANGAGGAGGEDSADGAQSAFNPSAADPSAFDPSAEPPTQIFEQPVQPTSTMAAQSPRVANSRALTPILFNPEPLPTREAVAESPRTQLNRATDADTAALEPAPLQPSTMDFVPATTSATSTTSESPPAPAPPTEPLLVVDDHSSIIPLAETEESFQPAEGTDFSAATFRAGDSSGGEDDIESVPSKLPEVSPFPPVPEMQTAQAVDVTPPVVSSEAFAADAVVTKTLAQSPVNPGPGQPRVDETLGSQETGQSTSVNRGVVESDIELPGVVGNLEQTSAITVDTNLTHDWKTHPEPVRDPVPELAEESVESTTIEAPIVETDWIAEAATALPATDVAPEMAVSTLESTALEPSSSSRSLPELDPPVSDAIPATLPIVKLNQVAESDFEPLPEQIKRCPHCNHENCSGCSLPDAAQFAGHIPDFDPGRSVTPTPVAVASLPNVDLIKKNFANVEFSPTDLPLPSGAPTEEPPSRNIVASFDASEGQFRTASFDEGEDQREDGTDVPAVGVEALMKLNAVTWQSRLAQTVDLVKQQLVDHNIDSDTRTSLEVNLRLLDVLGRQMDDIVENQQQFSPSENQYWQDQLEAITSMLKIADPQDARANELLRHHTAHETLAHLRNAVAHLESLANLRVVSGEFCTEVSGYGQFQPFTSNVFPTGQKVLVYCEIENFNSDPHESDSGVTYRTRLRGSYAIYDSSGHAVQQAEFPTLEDVARKRRRDFYMHLPITIGDLAAGRYELHLLVEDLGGNKTASLTPPLEFIVEAFDERPVARQARRN